jgi:hypothetical protein
MMTANAFGNAYAWKNMPAHTATKKAAGVYVYRWFKIELVSDSGYRAWNIFTRTGEVFDAAETLSQAKKMIDAHYGAP